MLAAVKSLFKFAKQLGFIPFDTAAVLKLPKAPNTLASRILSEQQVNALLGLPNSSRNHAIIVLLYASGLRVSELCSLKWEDLQPRNNSGQLTTTGKGSKTRSILLPASTWTELQSLPRTSDLVFKLKPNQIRRIVKDAARHAGLGIKVSPHFLRHAHASHALNHNAPVHLVSNTLGHASLASTTRYCHANPDQSSSQFLNL
jgi:integrase/recombinase XerD